MANLICGILFFAGLLNGAEPLSSKTSQPSRWMNAMQSFQPQKYLLQWMSADTNVTEIREDSEELSGELQNVQKNIDLSFLATRPCSFEPSLLKEYIEHSRTCTDNSLAHIKTEYFLYYQCLDILAHSYYKSLLKNYLSPDSIAEAITNCTPQQAVIACKLMRGSIETLETYISSQAST